MQASMSSEAPLGSTRRKKATKHMSFDFAHALENITWVFTDTEKDGWIH